MDGVGHFHGFVGTGDLSSGAAKREFDCLSLLRKQADASERKMSTLRQRLKRPETYLTLLASVFFLIGADALREPRRQWSARGYVAAVHLYQRHLSLASRVQCKFEPTCSHYSEEAVDRFGIGRGLRLTAARLWRCRSGVTRGTQDPVPENTQAAQMRSAGK
jgi:putative membrane protein insertion efficiency factor